MVLGLATYGRSMLMNGPSLHKPGDPYSGRLPRGAPYTNAQGIYAYYEVQTSAHVVLSITVN